MKQTEKIPYDLVIAYRKAKADIYYSSNPRIFDLYEYEKNLEDNLRELNRAIQEKDHSWFARKEFLGSYSIIPSSISELTSKDAPDDMVKFIPWQKSKKTDLIEEYQANFRLMEECSIDFHVLSSLWIARVGSFLDTCLGEEVYANRIRRRRDESYNELSIGNFKPYFYGYSKWRDSGLDAIEQVLDSERSAIAITADVEGYFHRLRPHFLINKEFKKTIGFDDLIHDPKDRNLHELFTEALINWEFSVAKTLNLKSAGLPVGLAASGLIANLALVEFDRQVKAELSPRFYGRYVDDIIIVLETSSESSTSDYIWNWVAKRVPSLCYKSGNPVEISLNYLGESKLLFQEKKSKILELDGFHGRQTLATLRKTIQENSSEWSLLPVLPEEAEDVPQMIFRTLDVDGSDVDNLSKATELSSTRSGFAVALRNFEALARDVSVNSWENYRKSFYKAIREQVLTPAKYFELANYIPRVLALSIQCGDLQESEQILQSIKEVVRHVSGGMTVDLKSFDFLSSENPSSALILATWRRSLTESLVSTIHSLPYPTRDRDDLARIAKDLSSDDDTGYRKFPPFEELFQLDLAKIAYKEILTPPELRSTQSLSHRECLHGPILSESSFMMDQLSFGLSSLLKAFNFVHTSSSSDAKMPKWNSHGFVFATRPIGVSEILLWTRIMHRPCITRDLSQWLTVTRGYEGNQWLSDKKKIDPNSSILLSQSNLPDKTGKVRIAVASLLTHLTSMISAAMRQPDLSLSRYSRITKLTNDVLSTNGPRPHYLLLPEASIPPNWFLRVAKKLMYKDISLIAGIEFLHAGSQNYVRNQIWHGLVHDELGFRSLAVYRQDKQLPAPGEERFLWSQDELLLKPEVPWESPPIIKHGKFKYSSLICSELTNIKHRSTLRGKIDALLIAESNKDIATFNALVESSALDIHCYVAQSNNRQYGDSRIRAPRKERHERDLVQVKGGLNDHFIIGEIDVTGLRRFQTAYRSQSLNYKPVPDGFQNDMDTERRVIP